MTIQKLAEALQILTKYCPENANIAAEHDQIWLAENYPEITSEDKARLEELGLFIDSCSDSWSCWA